MAGPRGGEKTLEIQDSAGAALSFRKGKTLEEKSTAILDFGGGIPLFRTSRPDLLQRKWEPVSGEGPAVQFTKDGTMIRFDGMAARYTFTGEEPNEVVSVQIDETQQVVLRVLSLGRDELVLAGDGGTVHYKRGTSITDAEAEQRAQVWKERLKVAGKAVAVTAGAVGVGIALLGMAAATAATRVTCRTCGLNGAPRSDSCPRCGATN